MERRINITHPSAEKNVDKEAKDTHHELETVECGRGPDTMKDRERAGAVHSAQGQIRNLVLQAGILHAANALDKGVTARL